MKKYVIKLEATMVVLGWFIRNACKGKIACGGAGGAGFVGFIENSCTGKFYL